MTLAPAPFHAELADGPENGQAWWVTADDGVRIRIGGWRKDGAKGTVLLFNGRTEYIEKYGRNASDFLDHGYNLLSVDWRGQGLADRMIKDPRAGHVRDFADYQKDVRTLMTHAEDAGFAGPYFLIGHSMGGAIGYRALTQGLPVAAAAFSAPMWGLILPILFRPFARWIANAAITFGRSEHYVLTGSSDSYLREQEFGGNELTSDPDMYAYLKRQARQVDGFALGSPTMSWLARAFDEIEFIQTSDAPDVPCRTFIGSDEKIVDNMKIAERMVRWPSGSLIKYNGGRHEMLMDTPEMRGRMTTDLLAFFDSHLPS